MTKPEDIREPTYKAIWEKLQTLSYPCVIVVYGGEKTTITSHNRSEYPSRFGISRVANPAEAWAVVDCDWPGYPPDLDVYAIPLPPDGKDEFDDPVPVEPIDLN